MVDEPNVQHLRASSLRDSACASTVFGHAHDNHAAVEAQVIGKDMVVPESQQSTDLWTSGERFLDKEHVSSELLSLVRVIEHEKLGALRIENRAVEDVILVKIVLLRGQSEAVRFRLVEIEPSVLRGGFVA